MKILIENVDVSKLSYQGFLTVQKFSFPTEIILSLPSTVFLILIFVILFFQDLSFAIRIPSRNFSPVTDRDCHGASRMDDHRV